MRWLRELLEDNGVDLLAWAAAVTFFACAVVLFYYAFRH